MKNPGPEEQIDDIHKSFESIWEVLRGIPVCEVPLHMCDPKQLDVREGDFDEHVALQPAAMSYFVSLKQAAEMQLDRTKGAYDRWRKRTWLTVKRSLEQEKAGKVTLDEIEATLHRDYEKQIDEWQDRIAECQRKYASVASWFEGWRQKSFSIREHANAVPSEMCASPHISGPSNQGGGTESRAPRPQAPKARSGPTSYRQRREEFARVKSMIGRGQKAPTPAAPNSTGESKENEQ